MRASLVHLKDLYVFFVLKHLIEVNIGTQNPLTLATDEIYLLIGDYNAGTTTFTANLANGSDAIVLMGGDGLNTANIFTTSDDMFIMTGVGRGLTAANFV